MFFSYHILIALQVNNVTFPNVMTKIALWVLMFSILSVYSWFALNPASHSPQIAYARTIAADEQFANSSHFVVLREQVTGNAFQRIVDRLRMRQDVSEEICAVSQRDFDSLMGSGNYWSEEMQVNGASVFVANPNNFREDFHQQLRSIVHCKKVEAFERVIMMFSSHVS